MEFEVEYVSTNNGGFWWLTEENWYNLQDNGWEVHWHVLKPDSTSVMYLGTPAKTASKIFMVDTKEEAKEKAIVEFEQITGQDFYARGCDCCGRPHNMYID